MYLLQRKRLTFMIDWVCTKVMRCVWVKPTCLCLLLIFTVLVNNVKLYCEETGRQAVIHLNLFFPVLEVKQNFHRDNTDTEENIQNLNIW